jgi:hypothetical protein
MAPSTELRWLASASRSSTWAPAACQRLQQPGLARACGAAHHLKVEALHQRGMSKQHGATKRLVAAFDQCDPKAYLVQHQRKRTAAFAPRQQ